MLPRKLIATAVVPDSTGPRGQSDEISPGDELHLYQRGEDFQICVGNWELMTSRATSSEMQLAELKLHPDAEHASAVSRHHDSAWETDGADKELDKYIQKTKL